MSSSPGAAGAGPCPDPVNSYCSPSVPVDLGLLFLVPAVAFIIGLFIFVFLMYISSRFFGLGQPRPRSIEVGNLRGGSVGGLNPSVRDSFPCTTLTLLREEDTAWSKAVAEDVQCAICLSEYGAEDVLRQLPCRHVLHRDCIDSWLDRHTSCPTCRMSLVPSPPGEAPTFVSPSLSLLPGHCAPPADLAAEDDLERGERRSGEERRNEDDNRHPSEDLEQGGGATLLLPQGVRSPPSRVPDNEAAGTTRGW